MMHRFFDRRGGVSKGIYASLNCGRGSDDDVQAVDENRRRVAAEMNLAAGRLITLYQIHSDRVESVTTPWAPEATPEADGLATNTAGVALGILTADCAPVLFADAANGVAGAAHAGWKGALAGILENTIQTMINLGAEQKSIVAAVGPCISQAAYEVGDEFRENFLDRSPSHSVFFGPGARERHWQFDLTGFVTARLRETGVRVCLEANGCTYGDEDRFFSYRRATHRGEADYGRQISVIAMGA